MNRKPGFGMALVYWFVAGMATRVALTQATDQWSEMQRRARFEAHCSVQGGTLVESKGGAACLTCDAD